MKIFTRKLSNDQMIEKGIKEYHYLNIKFFYVSITLVITLLTLILGVFNTADHPTAEDTTLQK